MICSIAGMLPPRLPTMPCGPRADQPMAQCHLRQTYVGRPVGASPRSTPPTRPHHLCAMERHRQPSLGATESCPNRNRWKCACRRTRGDLAARGGSVCHPLPDFRRSWDTPVEAGPPSALHRLVSDVNYSVGQRQLFLPTPDRGAVSTEAGPPSGLHRLVFTRGRSVDAAELRRLSPAVKYHRG